MNIEIEHRLLLYKYKCLPIFSVSKLFLYDLISIIVTHDLRRFMSCMRWKSNLNLMLMDDLHSYDLTKTSLYWIAIFWCIVRKNILSSNDTWDVHSIQILLYIIQTKRCLSQVTSLCIPFLGIIKTCSSGNVIPA